MVGQARIQFASHRVSSDRESMASAYWEPMQPTSRHAEIDADDPLVVAIGALVRIELANKAAAGFPTLSRSPSSGIIKLLDYMAMLSEAELAGLLDAKARLAALNFFPAPLIAAAPEQLRSRPCCARAMLCNRRRSPTGWAIPACA